MLWVYALNTHGHNLFFQFDLGAVEGDLCIPGFLGVYIVQTRLLIQPAQHCIYALSGGGDSAINALGGQQQGAIDIVISHDF